MADVSQPLEALVFCGVLGAAGQFVRSLAGLKKMHDDATANNVSSADLFVASRLVFSLLIGFVAGVLAGIATGVVLGTSTLDTKMIFGIIASGYAGVDFIESMAPNIVGKTGAQAAQQRADDAQNKTADVAAKLRLTEMTSQRLTAPLDGILSGWVSVGAKSPGDDAIRSAIAFCLNGYKKPTQPVPAGAKYWQGQLSAQFKGSDVDWIQAACDNVHDEPSPFAADGLTVNSVYILRKFNASTPPSFKIEDFFACIQQCYQHPLGPTS